MRINEIVTGLAGLDEATQAKAVEAADSLRATNTLLAGLGAGGARRGPKPGSKRKVTEKAAPAPKPRREKPSPSVLKP